METKEDFFAYFQEEFSGLDNGVYTVVKGAGYGNGFIHFFMLEFKDGEVVEWRKTSTGLKYRNESTYYALPYFFAIRDKNNV